MKPLPSVPPLEPAPSSAAPLDASENGQPRYLRVARELRDAIGDGRYPIGTRLPTEHQLCEQFDISRFTAREAVRTLVADGLVTRRPRIGTVVTATSDAPRYAHGVATIQDLLQYASDTELRFVYIGKIALAKAQALDFGAEVGQEWTYAMGIRMAATAPPGSTTATPPICVTRLYLNPLLEGIESRLRGRRGAVQALIESAYGIAIDRVEQELQGILLDAEDAANLGAEPGVAGLRITRRYYGTDGVMLEYADNVHVAERFVYRMQLQR